MSLSKKKKPVKVEIYSKPDCHLCDEAKVVLLGVQSRYWFEITEVDITRDQAIYQEYKEQIPVVFIDGSKAFKYRVDEAKFVRKLKRLL